MDDNKLNNIDVMQLIAERHSVRQYTQQPIPEDLKVKINEYITVLQQESGLDIRFIDNGKKVFGGFMMKFIGWKYPPNSYFAFVGDKTAENQEKCGYYGEKLVLFVQSLGLNTCWVGMFQKSSANADVDGNTIITIAVGYGANNGFERKSKSIEQVSLYDGQMPQWFENGVKSALLAPTAINKQGFFIKGHDNHVCIIYSSGLFSNVDLGIVKYHFEQGAGTNNFIFVDDIKNC